MCARSLPCSDFMSELARVYARWGVEADAKRRAAQVLADGTARDCFVRVACGVDVPDTTKPVHDKDHKGFKAAEPAFEATANDPFIQYRASHYEPAADIRVRAAV